MKLYKKDRTVASVCPKELSMAEIGMLNSLLNYSNEELNNFNLYSISNDSRKDTILTFNKLKSKKYIVFNKDDETYYIYSSSQN